MQVVQLTRETDVYGFTQEFLLSSDLHIGHADFDYDLFKKEFDEAKEKKARIFINGDVFDSILPKDMKRYRKSGDKYFQVDSVLNKQVEEAYKLLKPYGHLIDVIGIGNHETSVVNHNAFDPVSGLISLLRCDGFKQIQHGGYEGFIVISLLRKNKNNDKAKSNRYVIFYNHGQGGKAEVTAGAIDLNRRIYVRADLIWLGHKHNKVQMHLPCEIGIDQYGNIYEKTKRGIITGAYVKNFRTYDIEQTGYQSSFSEEKQRTPQAKGGAFLSLRQLDIGIEDRISF